MGMTTAGRLLIVSHRLPVAVRRVGADVVVVPSAGGVATGLRGPHVASEGWWIGYPGPLEGMSGGERAELSAEFERLRLVPVELPEAQARSYYEGFSNQILWPLFHYLIDRLPLEAGAWADYVAVNERFADAVAACYRPGDRIWVHDYQLMLVPGLLRHRLPDARIGYFLHIPFPSSEVFRTLPWRESLLSGLLGADLVGFHSHAYLRHFGRALLEVLGVASEVDRVHHDGREIRIGVFPMGIDARAFETLSRERSVQRRASAIRREALGRRILLGIDRLDYTKGIPCRLLALERLLAAQPELARKLRLIQIAVPSREDIPDYQRHRSEVEELVGRINGTYGSVEAMPVHYLHGAIPREELVALYRTAHVMLVTPMRDGMNLVAKEFVASRTDDEGVLILSEFAGAASELGEAIEVNPFDIDSLVTGLLRALDMPLRERRTRMRGLRRRVLEFDAHRWSGAFLERLDAAHGAGNGSAPDGYAIDATTAVVERLRAARLRILLLDYDGTLVPHGMAADEARPDRAVLTLLRALSELPGTAVHVVSGRPRETLEAWLGDLDLTLWAEHGYWRRQRPGQDWKPQFPTPNGWADRIAPILDEFAGRTPGAVVERKSASLSWHFRGADVDLGALQARRLRGYLAEALHNEPVEIVTGNHVVEVRLHGVTKARAASRLPAVEPGRVEIMAIGDDASDEELFAALPPESLALHVGTGATRAAYRLPDPGAVRALLGKLVPPRA